MADNDNKNTDYTAVTSIWLTVFSREKMISVNPRMHLVDSNRLMVWYLATCNGLPCVFIYLN